MASNASTSQPGSPAAGEAPLAADKYQQLRYALGQHAIVSVADARARISYVNDRFCSVSGYSREELIGHNHRILNSATDAGQGPCTANETAHVDDFSCFFSNILENRIVMASTHSNDDPSRALSADYLLPDNRCRLLVAPIWLHTNVIGVVCCAIADADRECKPAEQVFVIRISDLLALHVENLRRREIARDLLKSEERLRRPAEAPTP